MSEKDKTIREKQKERERKTRSARKYGQAKRKHSKMGVYACCFASAAFLILAACIVSAYFLHGKTAGIVGGCGILSILLGIFGIRAAYKGFKEREKNYITCKVGMAGSIAILAVLSMIFIGGLR